MENQSEKTGEPKTFVIGSATPHPITLVEPNIPNLFVEKSLLDKGEIGLGDDRKRWWEFWK